MKKSAILFLILFLTLTSKDSHAQVRRIARSATVVEGNISLLFNTGKINISYDYSNMAIQGFSTQAAFFKEEKRIRGEQGFMKFMGMWESWPKTNFEPEFETRIKKALSKLKTPDKRILDAANYSTDGNINLDVKIVSVDPYFHHGFVETPFNLRAFCVFSDQQGNFLVSMDVIAYGSMEPSMEDGLTECYGIAGAIIGTKIRKYIQYGEE